MRLAGKLFDCHCVLKNSFNAYASPNLEYCSLVWMSSAESHLSFLDSVVHGVEELCECELCCMGHRRKENAL